MCGISCYPVPASSAGITPHELVGLTSPTATGSYFNRVSSPSEIRTVSNHPVPDSLYQLLHLIEAAVPV